MKIIADENIPKVAEMFSEIGQVTCLPGRAIERSTLSEAEVLLVRSITRVDRELLEGTSVRFVGTATIGTDHIDQDWLAEAGIGFSDAAGSNADSVAEYVVTALLNAAERVGFELAGRSIGIIGVGNIGSRVERMARLLGMTVILNDPPKQRDTGDTRYQSLDAALAADIVTCHVPLTRDGPDATFHLLDEARLAQLKPQAMLINASRGAVVDNNALKQRLSDRTSSPGPVVLDVWEGEPCIDVDLLRQVFIGTPHIAGYSLDGKINGTWQLYQALCGFLDQPCRGDLADWLPPPGIPTLEINTEARSDQALLAEAFNHLYDIMNDDRMLREAMTAPPLDRAQAFDALRKNYQVRREITHTQIVLTPDRPELARTLTAMGFKS